MQIRAATLDDLVRILELERATETAAHWTENDWRAAIAGTEPRRTTFVLELDETDSMLVQFADESRFAPEPGIQGFLVGRHLDAEMEIENVVIAQGMRRFGLGSLLLEQVLKTSKNQGVSRIFLEVRESNSAARRLYEKAGFVPNGKRKDYYREPEEDALLLEIIFT
jgi:[ribosomal protein S18]-alanine N-acetyltransferase